jgi:hypothetical protein
MAARSTRQQRQKQVNPSLAPIPGAVLVFSGHQPQRRAFPIGVEPLIVDRELLNLPDPKVSRPHALIIFDPVGWTVRDLGSKHGTSVHDRNLEHGGEWRAATGQVIRTGESLFVLCDDVGRFLTEEPAAQVEAPGPSRRMRFEEIPWLIAAALRDGPVRKAHVSLVASALMHPWAPDVRALVGEAQRAAATAHARGDRIVRDAHLAGGALLEREPLSRPGRPARAPPGRSTMRPPGRRSPLR